MEPEEFEARMREREAFRALRIDEHAWTIIRLDGRAFTQFTTGRFTKPFDERLRDHMVEAATDLLSDFRGIYGYTFSDEISILFPPGMALFNGRMEKLISVSAGVVSAAFTRASGIAAHFDSRLWQSRQRDEVFDYFRWRQSDAARCALNGWCYWTLRTNGLTREAAVARLANQDKAQQLALLAHYGIDYRQIPLWQKRGVGLYWEKVEKIGYDPMRRQPAVGYRRDIRCTLQLPAGEDYSRYLEDLIGHAGK